jgi:hypothetical protein
LQINPELGEYRVSGALEQLGIKLSPRTCGRILALNRKLYHLQMPRSGGRPKKELPFQSERRHQYWFVDVRYLDMHKLSGGMIYCISSPQLELWPPGCRVVCDHQGDPLWATPPTQTSHSDRGDAVATLS